MNFELTKEEEQRIIEFKRDMHMHPEPSHEEYRTTEKIKAFLQTIPGVEILEFPRELTGVIARIKGNGDGPEVALRADIDALRQEEEYDSPYRSQEAGLMHGCGHDFHTASLLGAAIILSNTRESWNGCVDLLFQEGEEATNGAQRTIDAGLFEVIDPQMFFGTHNRPEVPAGKVVCNEGPLMSAKTSMIIRIYGKTAHGSMPQYGNDAIVAASAVVMALQTVVSRSVDPQDSVVFTVGAMHGGVTENLIADEVEMKASMRALGVHAKENALKALEEIISSVPKAYGCTGEVEYTDVLPMVYNSPEMTGLAKRAVARAIGEENIVEVTPSMASEDFSLFMERVPSYFYWVGSGTEGEPCYAWHNTKFHTNDNGIGAGARTLAAAAVTALEELSK